MPKTAYKRSEIMQFLEDYIRERKLIDESANVNLLITEVCFI